MYAPCQDFRRILRLSTFCCIFSSSSSVFTLGSSILCKKSASFPTLQPIASTRRKCAKHRRTCLYHPSRLQRRHYHSHSHLHYHYPSTPELSNRYPPNVVKRMEKDACFRCQQKGHWAQDCPLKNSNYTKPFNNDSHSSKNTWCRCGHGFWEVKTVKYGENKGKMYYACPVKRGAKCRDFVIKWCDDPNPIDDSYLQPPPFRYPECECGAGVCRRVVGTLNHAVKYYFTCPIRENHGSCGYVVWEDELLDNNSAVRQSCKRPLDGCLEGDQNDQSQTDNDFGEGGSLLVKHRKRTRIMDSSEITTFIAISQAKLSQRKDAVLKKARPLSRLSRPSMFSQENVFQRHILFGGGSAADESLGFCPMGWLGRLLYFCPTQSMKFPSSQPIFCCVFPSFNPIVVPEQESIPDGPCGFSSLSEQTQLSTLCGFSSLSQQTQLSTPYRTEFSSDDVSPKISQSSESKLMSKAQRQRQMAFVAQQQLLADLIALEPHEHESMREAAEDTFAMLDNLGATDKQFYELIWDFINLTSSVAQMTQTIENSLTPEEHNKCLEEEKARLDHIQNEYAKTEALFKVYDQRRQSLCKDISDLEAMLHEKQNQLKFCELETRNRQIELGDLKCKMFEAETVLKARTEQAKVAEELMEEIQQTQTKQSAAKTALKKATLGLEYFNLSIV